MLQLHQRTCAPSAVSVSMSTAVWIVMCNEPVMRAPLRGCSSVNSARNAMSPGISCSASSISLRPNAARDRSATLKSSAIDPPPRRRVYVRSWAGTNWPARDSPTGAELTGRPRWVVTALLRHGFLDLVQNRDGSGVDPFQRRQLEARDRAEEHEVEQLREGTVALGAHLLHTRDDFLRPLPHELEAPHHLRVL